MIELDVEVRNEIQRSIRDLCSDYLWAMETDFYGSDAELLVDFIADLEKLSRRAP